MVTASGATTNEDECPPPEGADTEVTCEEYYRRLNAVRTEGDWEGWTDFFLDGVATIADEAVASARYLLAVVAEDRARVLAQDTTSVSAAWLFELLPNHPILTVAAVMKLVETSKPTATIRRSLGRFLRPSPQSSPEPPIACQASRTPRAPFPVSSDARWNAWRTRHCSPGAGASPTTWGSGPARPTPRCCARRMHMPRSSPSTRPRRSRCPRSSPS